MRLSCAAWSFPELTLTESVALSHALGFDGLDVGGHGRAAVDGERLFNPQALGQEVAALDVVIPCYFHLFGGDIRSRNCALPEARASNVEEFIRVTEFCVAARIPTVFISPGIVNPGQTTEASIAESARSLRQLVEIAARAGVGLTVEPHVRSNVESITAAQSLLEQVEGLRLTLDYSHFNYSGLHQDEIDALLPAAAHLHLRQSAPGRVQERMEQGVIDVSALLVRLAAINYGGWITIEYVHQDFMGMSNVDVLTETVKMRDLVRAQWAGPGAAR